MLLPVQRFQEHFLQVDQLCQRLSPFDVTLITLGTSFVSHLYFRYVEPRRSYFSLLILLIIVPTLLSIPISYHVGYPLASIPLAFASYVAFLVFFTVSYRLSPFHPLANYPGPVIAKTSNWWGAYIGTKGNLHLYYKSLHDRYGDVVRVGPNELSIRDASIINLVLGQNGLPKGPRWDGPPGRPSLVDQRDPTKHLEQRKPWNRAFATSALKEYDELLMKRVRQLTSCLEDRVNASDQKAGVVLDVVQWFTYFATDFMGDAMFGGGFELMKTEGRNDGVRPLIDLAIHLRAIFSHVSYIIPFLAAIPDKNGAFRRVYEFSKEKVAQRLKSGTETKDLFYHLSGEEMPESERIERHPRQRDFYLIHNPAEYKRLQDEVDAAFPSGEEPLDVTKMGQMEWLNACINETLRLQPPVPSGSGRSLDKGKGPRTFGRWFIPEETQLSLHTYSIHRDPHNFHTPDAFLPERWLSNGARKGAHNMDAFFPFGYGRTMCVGKYMGLIELRVVLCWMLRSFRFSKAPGVTYEGWEERIKDWVVIHNDPLQEREEIDVREMETMKHSILNCHPKLRRTFTNDGSALSTGASVGEHNTAAFFPFSYGPTTYAGKNLALMMLLCRDPRRFRFSKVPGVNFEQ
ncbi:cytochrome P450 [Lactarius quietus]|nr:cytochrome P450 [Lactarius quietus]